MFESIDMLMGSLFSPGTILADTQKKELKAKRSETPAKAMGFDLVDEAWDECLQKLGGGSFPVVVNMSDDKK